MKRKNLINFRIDLGLKSKEMAEKLGITATRYSNIENGKVKISEEIFYKIQEVFGDVNVLELLKKKK